jgi:serine/threonine protein kinase
MEYANGGTLKDFLESKNNELPLDAVIQIMFQLSMLFFYFSYFNLFLLVYGIQAIHEENLIHRRLALKNILVHNTGNVHIMKISDFGTAPSISLAKTYVGFIIFHYIYLFICYSKELLFTWHLRFLTKNHMMKRRTFGVLGLCFLSC